ncbi:hypothetical protein ACM55F_18750, partial [Flavobacterium sp. XS2P12]
STVACAADIVTPTVPVVTDNCGNALTPAAAVISATPACEGTVTYTYTFTDCEGTAHDWVYTYSIDDTIAPTATVPANIIGIQCKADIPIAKITDITDETDNCSGSVTVTVNDTNDEGSGCKGSPYIVTRTYTLRDCAGNLTNLVQTITVEDTIAPLLSGIPANTTVECDFVPTVEIEANISATDNCDTAPIVTYLGEERIDGNCPSSYTLTRTWTATDACGNSSTKSQIIKVQDTTPPTITPPQNIILSSGANCVTDISPTITGNPTYNDICDSNLEPPTYTDTNCFGNSDNQEVNAGNGNYFPFTVSGFDGISASSIEKIALAFETNQGKGRAEFTLIAPNGQGIILVGPYCTGGACDDANSNTKELYLPIFYPNSSAYVKWNNNNFVQNGVSQNFTPYGATTSTNTIPELTSYVSSFENFSGTMNGTWLIYSRKQASVNGSIEFKSVCLTPASCPGDKIISRTWTVTDACGNTATANQTIKIEDTTAPTASNPAAITLSGCNGTFPAADIALVTDEADACSTPVVAFVGDSAPALVGCTETTIRTYSVTDACGN